MRHEKATEYYGFDLLPQEVHADSTVRQPALVTVSESSDIELDHDGIRNHSKISSSNASPLSPPTLSHGFDSDSDSASDSDESDESDDFPTAITSPSPTDTATISLSALEEEEVEPDESDLGLHRTKSLWRPFGNASPFTDERRERKERKPIGIFTDDIERLKLATA